MSAAGYIILIWIYLQSRILPADNENTEIDNMIEFSMNLDAWPCDDFYAYACGNYKKQQFFNASLLNRNLHDYATHQYHTAIVKLLESYGQVGQQNGEYCQALAEKVRIYLDSCRKLTKRNLTRYLDEMKPGPELNWPIFENETNLADEWPHNKDFDVLHLLGKLNSIGLINIVFEATRTQNGTIVIKRVDPLNYWALENQREIVRMISFMGVGVPTAIFEGVLETEKLLTPIIEGTRNDRKIVISFGDLLKRYPNLNFTSYFKEWLGKQLPLDTNITIYSPSIFQKLNDKIFSFDQAKLCNYLMLRFLMFFDTTTEHNNMVCVAELRKLFDLAVNFLYYQHHSAYQEKFLKPDVTEIYKVIVDMMGKQLRSHALKLTSHQIELVMAKLAAVRLKIGNLPENATCATIEALYASLPALDANNYYKNHLLMLKFLKSKEQQAFFPTYIHTDASIPSIVYDGTRQIITLNYPYLMAPVYDFHYNILSKYSLLGFVLARELVQHCEVVKLNRMGDFSKPLDYFLKCQGKLLYYGGPFEIEDHILADSVAGEVIRKLVTMKFFTFQPIDSVAGWKKSFFMSMAQHYCIADSEESADGDNEGFALNRIAINMEGFAQAFNCPQYMKPLHICRIQ